WRHAGPGLVLEETAVGEGQRDVRGPAHGEVRVEVRRVARANPEDAAALRRLGARRRRHREPGGDRQRGSGLQDVTSSHTLIAHRQPPAARSPLPRGGAGAIVPPVPTMTAEESRTVRRAAAGDAAAIAELVRRAFAAQSRPTNPPPSALRETAATVAEHLSRAG